jgi:hypothetical protein
MSRFKPGQSGNPNGRPKNAKSSVTALRKDLITDQDLQDIVDVVIGKAKEGDLTAAGMILDRRLPRLRVTADFGLEKDSLAEQLKAARERVAAASRPVIQVITGVEGGLDGGDDIERGQQSHPAARVEQPSPAAQRPARPDYERSCSSPPAIEQPVTYSRSGHAAPLGPTPPQDYDPYA